MDTVSPAKQAGSDTIHLFADAEILQAIERVTQRYKFCPNRVWALAGSLPEREQTIPVFFPSNDTRIEDMFAHKHESRSRAEEHSQCTYDFCERSELDFTSVSQRHESRACESAPCDPLQGLFPIAVLAEGALAGSLTAWQLYGRRLVTDEHEFMAISHVWSDGTGSGATGGTGVNRCLFNFFRDLARSLGCNGIWWDTICVPREKAARTKAINLMHNNFQHAKVTVVHDCFIRSLEWIDGETGCLALVLSPWFSRGWTALELANSNKVKVLFKQGGRSILKDLDEDLLARPYSRRHQLLVKVIRSVRNNQILDIDQLLNVLGARHTSWPKDTAVIAGLLTGVALSPDQAIPTESNSAVSQQEIFQKVLKKLRFIACGHLFHNLPTIHNGSSWCPSRLLSLPVANTRRTLRLDRYGNVFGNWKVFALHSSYDWKYELREAHPLTALRVRVSLKTADRHLILVDPEAVTILQAVVVRLLTNSSEEGKVCQFIGTLSFNVQPALPDYSMQELVIINKLLNDPTEYQNSLRSATLHDGPSIGPWNNSYDISHSTQTTNDDSIMENSLIVSDLPWGRARRRRSTYSDEPLCPRKLDTVVQSNDDGGHDVGSHESAGSSFTAREDQDPQMTLFATPNTTERTPFSRMVYEGRFDGARSLIEAYSHDYELPVDAMLSLIGKIEWKRSRFDAESVETESVESKFVKSESFGSAGSALPVPGLLQRLFTLRYDEADCNGQTPLSWTARNGQADMVKFLLQWHEFDIDSKDERRWTPLIWAISKGHQYVLELLIVAGADTNFLVGQRGGSVRSPLSFAAEAAMLPAIQLLLDHGASDDEDFLRSALAYAAMNGHIDVMRLLLERNSAVNGGACTPLTCAVEGGKSAAVKFLLARGGQPDLVSIYPRDNKRTPLSLASGMGGHLAIVDALLEKGAKTELKDANGWTPLLYAAKTGHRPIVQLLLDKGATIDVKDTNDRTALSYAAQEGHHHIVQLLLDAGAEVETRARETGETGSDDCVFVAKGATPLCYAAAHGQDFTVDILRRGGARINAGDNNGSTPIIYAAQYGHLETVRLLLRRGAKVDGPQSRVLETPLHRAAHCGHERIVSLLLQAGADATLQDFELKTPRDIAVYWRDSYDEARLDCPWTKVIQLLDDYQAGKALQ